MTGPKQKRSEKGAMDKTASGDSPILIVGLGNVGERYLKTRHNVGWMVIDRLASSSGLELRQNDKLKARIATGSEPSSDRMIVLAQPTTMMNLSGQAVGLIQNFYKVEGLNVIVVYDDKDIDFGEIKVQPGGRGTGGHNGVASLPSDVLGQANRVRIGVANEALSYMDTADFVLQKFATKEHERLEEILIPDAVEQIKKLISELSSRISG